MGGITPELASVIKTLVDAKPDSDDGWALRALVANQAGLFSPFSDFAQNYADWLTNPGNKLDKCYDTFKALLGDEDVKTKVLKGRFGWLNPAGMGLSFGVSGFLAGAAAELLAQELKTAAAESAAVQAAMKRATAFNAWCHQQTELIEAIVKARPPSKPVIARVSLKMEDALDVLINRSAQGEHFNKSTKKMMEHWRTLPTAVQGATVELEFFTTEDELKKAGTVENLASNADRIRVPVRNVASGVVIVYATPQRLGELFRNAHRIETMQKVLSPIAKNLGEFSKLSFKLPASAVAGMSEKAGWFSIFGAWLQWRCWQTNQAKLDALANRLKTQQGLTEEQKTAIQYAIDLTTLGLNDNKCGVLGGVAELAGVGANLLKWAGTASIGFSVAAFAGCGGAFMNAAQNYHKAMAKQAGNDAELSRAYFAVFGSYLGASIAFFGSGVEIGLHWFLKKKALEMTLRGTASVAFGSGVRLLGLSLTGWGLVLTIASFSVEGIVTYYDRTALEQWVENSYFGTKPKYRGIDGKANDPKLWDAEAEAFGKAVKAANEDGAAAA